MSRGNKSRFPNVEELNTMIDRIIDDENTRSNEKAAELIQLIREARAGTLKLRNEAGIDLSKEYATTIVTLAVMESRHNIKNPPDDVHDIINKSTPEQFKEMVNSAKEWDALEREIDRRIERCEEKTSFLENRDIAGSASDNIALLKDIKKDVAVKAATCFPDESFCKMITAALEQYKKETTGFLGLFTKQSEESKEAIQCFKTILSQNPSFAEKRALIEYNLPGVKEPSRLFNVLQEQCAKSGLNFGTDIRLHIGPKQFQGKNHEYVTNIEDLNALKQKIEQDIAQPPSQIHHNP